MKVLLYISRVIVGSLFVISGLIKANDPLGFSYKLNDYFAESALNLTFLDDYALLLACLACLAEIVLGFAVIFGGKMKVATWSLVGLTIFFGWLTLYTATCDPLSTYTTMVDGQEVERTVTCVTDCGCFGDALKGSLGRSLTPWESFFKDLILFIFILPMFFKRKSIQLNDIKDDMILLPFSLMAIALLSWVFSWYFPVLFSILTFLGYFIIKKIKPKSDWIIAGFVTVISVSFILYCYTHLPIRDYRPYAVGKNIWEQMQLPPDAKQDIYETVLSYKNKNTGEVKEFNTNNYPWQDTLNWEFVDSQSKLIQKGDEAPIHDFSISDVDGNDYAEDYLNEEGYLFIFISKNIRKADESNMQAISKVIEEAYNNGYYAIGLTASPKEDAEEFRHKHQLMCDFYFGDETTIKTILRANPGVLILKKGTVVGKWNGNHIPDFETIKRDYLK